MRAYRHPGNVPTQCTSASRHEVDRNGWARTKIAILPTISERGDGAIVDAGPTYLDWRHDAEQIVDI
jgi:hypothetical protein